MKIINVRTQKLQPIPFALGEGGRARRYVPVTPHPTNPPQDAAHVGVYVLPEHAGVMLVQNDAPGLLLRINTKGVYTRGSDGSIELRYGKATCLAEGYWAAGDAGGLGSGPDALWQVESPDALFAVRIQGGVSKGYGWFYAIVADGDLVAFDKKEEIARVIALDDMPAVTRVVRAAIAAGASHPALWDEALAIAEKIEKMDNEPPARVQHFFFDGDSLDSVCERFGIVVPPSFYRDDGVDRIAAGTLVPGDKALASFAVGPGGGKRYRWRTICRHNLTLVDQQPGNRCVLLFLVDHPQEDWYYTWEEFKDGQHLAYGLANKTGVHRWYSDEPPAAYAHLFQEEQEQKEVARD
jgi:hypothetical protein